MHKHRSLRLEELCDFVNGNGFKPQQWKSQGLPIIRIQNLNGSTDFNYYDGPVRDRWVVEPGVILFAWAGVKGVSFGPCIWPGPKGVLNQHIFRVEPREEVDIYWLYGALELVTARIEAKAHGFKASLLHIQRSEITNQIVDVPKLDEQRRIGSILRTWDEAIDKADRLIEAKTVLSRERYRIFFGGGHGAHKGTDLMPLSKLSRRVRTADDGGGHPVLTISGKEGFLRQDEKYGRFMAGKSVESYTLLRRGEFSYNKGNSKTYPQGCVYRLEDESGLVPHVYISFCLTSSKLDSDYFVHVCRSGYLNRQLSRLINSGVRNNGLLNITAQEFFTCKIPVPSLSKQKTIARICHDADREIAILKEQRGALEKQRRGLMQKLLTGEWTVSAAKSREAAE
ncbi:restriction endonuclease subunit S [Methylocystis sp. Sn-Cys]|uniref:restriction endonuclease subunit S n=1 Tax=Methylocystis sp. Sn-Cys TaxID=1701263 RepID=UPI00192342D2|nr:restriction endonuclease subunit S [Methylocystis sp. Sn-Cys]MBL1255942.1 restriction endonuclease subunit S [Methylocystis sp. Sn-Cys]